MARSNEISATSVSDEVLETLLVLFFAACLRKPRFYGFFFGGRYFFSTEVTTT